MKLKFRLRTCREATARLIEYIFQIFCAPDRIYCLTFGPCFKLVIDAVKDLAVPVCQRSYEQVKFVIKSRLDDFCFHRTSLFVNYPIR